MSTASETPRSYIGGSIDHGVGRMYVDRHNDINYDDNNDGDTSDIDTLDNPLSARSRNENNAEEFSRLVDSRFMQIMTSLSNSEPADDSLQRNAAAPADDCSWNDDLDSIQTEDIEAEFKRSLVVQRFSDGASVGLATRTPVDATVAVSGSSSPSRRYHDRRSPIAVRPSTTPPWHAAGSYRGDEDDNDTLGSLPGGADRNMFSGSSRPSNQRSTKTASVKNTAGLGISAERPEAGGMCKRVASIPVTSFDRFLVDSDADTVTSRDVRRQFQAAITSGTAAGFDVCSLTTEAAIDNDRDLHVRNVLSSSSAAVVKDSVGTRGKKPPAAAAAYRSPNDAVNYNWKWADPVHATPMKGIQSDYHDGRQLPPNPAAAPVAATAASNAGSVSVGRRSNRSSFCSGMGEDLLPRQSPAVKVTGTSPTASGTSRHATRSPVRTSGVAPQRPASVERQSRLTPTSMTSFHSADHAATAVRRGSPQRNSLSIENTDERIAIHNKMDLELSRRLQQELANLQNGIKKSIRAKEAVQTELQQLEQTIDRRRQEVKSTEKQMKETNKKAEEGRSELMLIEFKQQSMMQELEQLSNSVNQRRLQLQQLETSEKKLQELGFTKEEVTRLILDSEELKERLRQYEGFEREKTEVGSQLATARDALMAEKKNSREKLEAVKQELEAKQSQIDDLTSLNDSLRQKVADLDARCKQSERDRNSFAKETSQEYSSFRSQMEQQMAISRENAAKELASVKHTLSETADQLSSCRLECSRLGQQNAELREQVQHLKVELSKQSEVRDQLISENMKSLKIVISEKELALATYKTQSADELKREMELAGRERQQALRQLELKYNEQLTAQQSQLSAKDMELQTLIDRIQQHDLMMKQLTERVKEEAYQKFQQLLIEERAKWDKEKEAELALQLVSIRDESDRATRQLRDDVSHERSVVHSCHRQLDALRTELEEAKQALVQATRDKQIAVSQLRETMELEKNHQILMMKDKLEQEMQMASEKLREAVKRQDDELERLRKERKDLQTKEEEMTRAGEKYEQTILNELQQECQRLTQSLNKSIKISSLASQSFVTSSKLNIGTQSAVRSSIASVLASLRMAGDDLRQELQQLRQEAESQQQSVVKLEKKHRADIEDLKEQLQKEKLDALETLKDRLIKENIGEIERLDRQSIERQKSLQRSFRDRELRLRNELETWRRGFAEEMQLKFHEELDKAVEKRLKRHRSNSARSSTLNYDGDNGSRRSDQQPVRTDAATVSTILAGPLSSSIYGTQLRTSASVARSVTPPPTVLSSQPDPEQSAAVAGTSFASSSSSRSRPMSHTTSAAAAAAAADAEFAAQVHRRANEPGLNTGVDGDVLRHSRSRYSSSVSDLSGVAAGGQRGVGTSAVGDRSAMRNVSPSRTGPGQHVAVIRSPSAVSGTAFRARSTEVSERRASPLLHGSTTQNSTAVSADSTLDLRQMELAVQRAENRARLAEERASRNDQLLNQKLMETSRLHGTVTQQSKDLVQLQRAYSQLQRTGRNASPTRYATAEAATVPSGNLRTSHTAI